MHYLKSLFLLILILNISCEKPISISMDQIAEKYVKLVLEVGQYDGDFVDAYYGPKEWRDDLTKLDSIPLDSFYKRATALIRQTDEFYNENLSEMEKARVTMMLKQLIAVRAKIEMIGGERYSFNEEAKLLYDAVPPSIKYSHFDELLSKLDSIVPGEGELAARFQDFSDQFIIPKEKLDTVFTTAIAEARKRTLEHFDLPENENFVLEYVNDKAWSGYNYYQGNSQSLIQINTDFPINIERAIDLACHEGYPGHHVYNALIEKHLVNDKGWVEFSVYPLFSPMSLIAEGSANYGIDVAFPGEDRVKYQKEVLFPLAGLDSTLADQYFEMKSTMAELTYARNEAARQFLNGEIGEEDYIRIVQKYALITPEKAAQSLRFVKKYRTYIINYNHGLKLVGNYIENQGGIADQPEKRWELFGELLSTPQTAGSLKWQ